MRMGRNLYNIIAIKIERILAGKIQRGAEILGTTLDIAIDRCLVSLLLLK
jgi:hypothetical protein